jgi:hypothetical protein
MAGSIGSWEVEMSLLAKLFQWKRSRPARIRICIECGMPIAEHKDWCSILRTMQAIGQAPVRPSPAK